MRLHYFLALFRSAVAGFNHPVGGARTMGAARRPSSEALCSLGLSGGETLADLQPYLALTGTSVLEGTAAASANIRHATPKSSARWRQPIAERLDSAGPRH